jgi:probable phosphomutase (TIGR03848 family)
VVGGKCTYPNLYSTRRRRDESGHTWGVLNDRLEKPVAMTTFLLIRHALCDPVGSSIAGRQPGIHLNEDGKRQAAQLADRLAGLPLAAMYSSPLERAQQTAEAVAAKHRLQVHPLEGVQEIDFGDWTGKTLAELEPLPEWRAFNSFRSGTRIPGGENMAEVLARALGALEQLRQRHPGPGALVGVVTHGDVLRVVLAHALGVPFDFMHRLELSPASVSILEIEDFGSRVLLVNSTGGWPAGVRRA